MFLLGSWYATSKKDNHVKNIWHKNYVLNVIKKDLSKEFPKMKNYGAKSPIWRLFTNLYSAKIWQQVDIT